MHMGYLPVACQNAFSDLRRMLIELDEIGIQGSLKEMTVGGASYLYDGFKIGQYPVNRYFGTPTDENWALGTRAKELRKAARDQVKVLQANACLAPDRETGAVLMGLARAGVFRAGGVLVGTFAFRCYEAELGIRLNDAAAATQDIDVAMHRTIAVAATEPRVPKILTGMGYAPSITANTSDAKPWRWTKGEMLVEFLTPDIGCGGQIAKLGIHAQQLKFMDYLLGSPVRVPVIYQSGVLVNVPDPARFAVHKLILASRRGRDSRDKSLKDRRQAAQLIEVLAADRPDELAEAYQDARERGPAWRKAIDATLRTLPDAAAHIAEVA
jgi:hypothetical protein